MPEGELDVHSLADAFCVFANHDVLHGPDDIYNVVFAREHAKTSPVAMNIIGDRRSRKARQKSATLYIICWNICCFSCMSINNIFWYSPGGDLQRQICIYMWSIGSNVCVNVDVMNQSERRRKKYSVQCGTSFALVTWRWIGLRLFWWMSDTALQMRSLTSVGRGPTVGDLEIKLELLSRMPRLSRIFRNGEYVLPVYWYRSRLIKFIWTERIT